MRVEAVFQRLEPPHSGGIRRNVDFRRGLFCYWFVAKSPMDLVPELARQCASNNCAKVDISVDHNVHWPSHGSTSSEQDARAWSVFVKALGCSVMESGPHECHLRAATGNVERLSCRRCDALTPAHGCLWNSRTANVVASRSALFCFCCRDDLASSLMTSVICGIHVRSSVVSLFSTILPNNGCHPSVSQVGSRSVSSSIEDAVLDRH